MSKGSYSEYTKNYKSKEKDTKPIEKQAKGLNSHFQRGKPEDQLTSNLISNQKYSKQYHRKIPDTPIGLSKKAAWQYQKAGPDLELLCNTVEV